MKTNNLRLKIYLTVFFILLFGGVSGFMVIENFSLTDALYFTIVTMATVGYGDIHPMTDFGKVLALIIIVGGVGTFLGVVASITDFFVNRREEVFRQQKLNMVTGLFFSEMGNELLKRFNRLDTDSESLHTPLNVTASWQKKEYDDAAMFVNQHSRNVDSAGCDIPELTEFLQKNEDFLLNLIGNPVIQEHEYFTDLLRAVFHLRDELHNRPETGDMPDADRTHLEGDIERIYNLLIVEWLRYIQYLKVSYGFLFSLAMRTNPFNPDASAVVRNA